MGAPALIIAAPGPLRDGLCALVDAMPQVGAIALADNVAGARRDVLDPRPALVLLDANLGGDHVWLTVRRTKRSWPRSRVIVLVSDTQQQREAEAAGADVALLEGFPAGRLVAAIVKLLPQPTL